MSKSYRDILDSAAGLRIPDNFNLFPSVMRRLNQRKTFVQFVRNRPVFALALAIIALILLTGVVYAIGHSLGYIPGAGIVDQGLPIRVLAEPVSVTRDGITLTVEQAILTSDKTFVVYRTDGIPQEARPKGESGFTCQPSMPTLLMPDGTELVIKGGSGEEFRTGVYFAPIPVEVDTAKFLLHCLQDVAPAAAPQDWELSLHFVPAPPELTVVPIIEVATPLPIPTAPASVSLAESDTFMGLSYHLQSMKHTQQGYIIETSLEWAAGIYPDYGVGTGADLTMTDVNGKVIELQRLQDEKYGLLNDPNRILMGNSMGDVAFAAPLTLTLPWVGANLPLENRPQFTFDPGTDPHPGQEWQIDQTIEVLGHSIRIVSARYVTSDDLKDKEWMRFMPDDLYGFEFILEADPAFRSIALSVQAGYSADGVGTSGTPTVRDENGIIRSYAMMGGKIASPLTIAVPYVELSHPWQITFIPADLATDVPIPTEMSLGAALQIEKVIPIDEGYYLIGRTTWDDARISAFDIGGWDAKLFDANGAEYPIEPANFDEVGITDVQPGQWIYKVYGKVFSSVLTLKVNTANVQLVQPYSFTFDLGTTPRLGDEWQIDQRLEILGYDANVQSAKFIQQGDLHGFEFSLAADPSLQGIPLNMESGIVNGYSGGGGATPRDENGVMKIYSLSDGQFTGPILVTVRSVVLKTDLKTTWSPPAAEDSATPIFVPQACVTLNTWKQAIDKPVALPTNLPQKVLLFRGALAPAPSIFIANLDGRAEQGLVFGRGTLSPDGSKLVFSGAENGLYYLDIPGGMKSTLIDNDSDYSPFWSPDGSQIAFMRHTNKGPNIFVTNLNGNNTYALTDTTDNLTLLGWMPDGRLIFNVSQQDGVLVQAINVSSGNIETLLSLSQSYDGKVSVSPDEKWIAYPDKVPGKLTPGIFVSRLDGSEKKLLIQLDYWMVGTSLWSPDGKWLVVNITDTDQFRPVTRSALINVDLCQVIPLTNLNGEITEWIH